LLSIDHRGIDLGAYYWLVSGPHSAPTLLVTIGETRDNYRTENIKFEIAILGRSAIAKFMAVPHYTYLVLKMPSPVGVLSL
jgi:hypothetical protein